MWRILAPDRFVDPAYGAVWKERFREKRTKGRHRLRGLPYFAWI
jgi:hypothetical protein